MLNPADVSKSPTSLAPTNGETWLATPPERKWNERWKVYSGYDEEKKRKEIDYHGETSEVVIFI